MSQIGQYRARLDESFQRMVSAHKDDGIIKRACMREIMICCNELRIDLSGYLKDKFVEQYKAELAMMENSEEYRCRDCGESFSTPQARNGHMAHCKKGGSHA